MSYPVQTNYDLIHLFRKELTDNLIEQFDFNFDKEGGDRQDIEDMIALGYEPFSIVHELKIKKRNKYMMSLDEFENMYLQDKMKALEKLFCEPIRIDVPDSINAEDIYFAFQKNIHLNFMVLIKKIL